MARSCVHHQAVDPRPLGDALKIALIKKKRVDEQAVLYQLADYDLNPSRKHRFKFKKDSPPVSVSCITHDDITVFQIRYGKDFWDSFRFAGNAVEKSGMAFNDGQLIHWTETLTKQ